MLAEGESTLVRANKDGRGKAGTSMRVVSSTSDSQRVFVYEKVRRRVRGPPMMGIKELLNCKARNLL